MRVVAMSNSVAGNVFRYTAGTDDLAAAQGINGHLNTASGNLSASYATTKEGCAAFSLSLEDEDAQGILNASDNMPSKDDCKGLATKIVAALTHNPGTSSHKSLLGDSSSILGDSQKRIKKVFLRVVVADLV